MPTRPAVETWSTTAIRPSSCEPDFGFEPRSPRHRLRLRGGPASPATRAGRRRREHPHRDVHRTLTMTTKKRNSRLTPKGSGDFGSWEAGHHWARPRPATVQEDHPKRVVHDRAAPRHVASVPATRPRAARGGPTCTTRTESMTPYRPGLRGRRGADPTDPLSAGPPCAPSGSRASRTTPATGPRGPPYAPTCWLSPSLRAA